MADPAPHRIHCHLDDLLESRDMALVDLAEAVGITVAIEPWPDRPVRHTCGALNPSSNAAGVLSILDHDTRSPSALSTTTTERRRCRSIPT
jgi:hypothetical protein